MRRFSGLLAGFLLCACGARSELERGEPHAAGAGGIAGSGSGAGGSGAIGTGGGGSAGTSAIGGSAGQMLEPPPDCGATISDLEDGTGRICEGNGRKGVWYAFNDSRSTQWPAPTAPGTPIAPSLIPGGREESTRAMHTFGDGFSEWGAGIGFDLVLDGTEYSTYDASAYDGIAFWAKSEAGPASISVRISTSATTLVKYGGTCLNEPCHPLATELGLSSEWNHYFIPFARLDTGGPVDRSQLTNVQFMTPEGSAFDYWVDDVRFFVGAPVCAAPAPAECEGALAFGDADVATSLRIRLGKTSGEPLYYSDTCGLYSLRVFGGVVESLAGLECLRELHALEIPQLGTAELSSLGALDSLSRLKLGSNVPLELSVLEGLPLLTHLDVTQVSEISILKVLRHLRSFTAASSTIQDLASLEWHTELVELRLIGNQVTDLTPLSGLSNLANLDLSGNPVADVTPLQGLEFRELWLGQTNVQDLAPIEHSFLSGATFYPPAVLDCSTQGPILERIRAGGVSVVPALCQ